MAIRKRAIFLKLNEGYANEWNEFLNRFDNNDHFIECQNLKGILRTDSFESGLKTSADEVRQLFSKLNISKAAGPDQLSCKLL